MLEALYRNPCEELRIPDPFRWPVHKAKEALIYYPKTSSELYFAPIRDLEIELLIVERAYHYHVCFDTDFNLSPQPIEDFCIALTHMNVDLVANFNECKLISWRHTNAVSGRGHHEYLFGVTDASKGHSQIIRSFAAPVNPDQFQWSSPTEYAVARENYERAKKFAECYANRTEQLRQSVGGEQTCEAVLRELKRRYPGIDRLRRV